MLALLINVTVYFFFFEGFARPETAMASTPNGLARIETHGAKTKKHENGICHDDSSAPVRAQTIDELHSLQRKRSAPTTPIKDGASSPFAAALSEEERQRQQLQSIRWLLGSLSLSLFLFENARIIIGFAFCFLTSNLNWKWPLANAFVKKTNKGMTNENGKF